MEDVASLIKNVYNLVENIHEKNYFNIGNSVGKILYDMNCMKEGKSTLGFLGIDSTIQPDPIEEPVYLLLNETALMEKQNDITNVDG